MKTYKLRKKDPLDEGYHHVNLTVNEIIGNPTNLHVEDVAMALLTELRLQKGLVPLEVSTYTYDQNYLDLN